MSKKIKIVKKFPNGNCIIFNVKTGLYNKSTDDKHLLGKWTASLDIAETYQ